MDVTFINNSKAYLRAMERAIDKSAHEIGLAAEGNAKIELSARKPGVDTGNLRNSVSYYVKGDEVWIGTPVDYGIYVHEGTKRMDRNPFLRYAVHKHVADYKKIIDDNLKNG